MTAGHRLRIAVALVAAAILPLHVAPIAAGVASVPAITAIAAGGYHTCALTSAGGVQCWGFNASGQVGDGTATNRLKAVNVSGLSSGVVAFTAGYYHTCALTNGGGVTCWGANDSGQLGNGTRLASLIPANVSGLTSGVTAIAAGGLHTCAVMDMGGVRCWGDNNAGQLGDGSTTDSLVPVDVSGLTSDVVGIAAGPAHTCAIGEGGELECWGLNSAGQLGDGTRTNRSSPFTVPGTAAVTAIAAGYGHTCALTSEGGVTCWGWNFNGQLGNGAAGDSFSPVAVLGLGSGVEAIAPGDSWAHACAVTGGGGIKCWGYNAYGQLGNGSATDSGSPVDVVGLGSGVQAVAAGYYHTCALTIGGAVKCWGNNYAGGLGNGSTADSAVPVDVLLASAPLPIPALEFAGTEDYLDAFNTPYTRYRLKVTNWNDYPAELFEFAADLPACGSTPGGRRTWVDIYDARNDSRIYGFCALTSPMELTQIWFGLPRGTPPPTGVYVTLSDHRTGSSVRSNTVAVPAPTSIANESAAGLPGAGGFSVSTKTVRRGTYITWRAHVSPSMAGERVEVWMATRTGGAWGPFARFSSRVLDAAGNAWFSFRSPTPKWISIRFAFAGNSAHAAGTSPARVGRYR